MNSLPFHFKYTFIIYSQVSELLWQHAPVFPIYVINKCLAPKKRFIYSFCVQHRYIKSILSHSVRMHPVLTVSIKQHLRTKEKEAPIHSLVGGFLNGRGKSNILWEHFLSSSHRVGKLLCLSHTSSRTGTHSFIRPLLNETMDTSVTITIKTQQCSQGPVV